MNYFVSKENILYFQISTNEYIKVSHITTEEQELSLTIDRKKINYIKADIETKCDNCLLANFNKPNDDFNNIYDKKQIRKGEQYIILFKDTDNCYFFTKDIEIYFNRKKINYTELKNRPKIIKNEIIYITIDNDNIILLENENENEDFIEHEVSVINMYSDESLYYFFKTRKSFIMCDTIKYTISDFTKKESDNFFLLFECDLDQASYYDFLEMENQLELIEQVGSFSQNEIKKIYLYVEAENVIEPNPQDLHNYVIISDILHTPVYQNFSKLCNEKCFYIGDYLIDILIKAKKLYENGKCYYSYYDIHAALFSFSNCASLFHSIKVILETKGGIDIINDDVFYNKNKKSGFTVELLKFYEDFNHKNTYVLCKLKELQEKFKETNRITKPDNNDEDLCVNVKNIVFKKDQCKFFEDIIGLENAIEKIESTFIMPVIYPSLYGKLSKGILLYGPPGTGKTLLVKAAINSLQRDYVQHNLSVLFFTPTPADLKGKYVGESEKKIKELFNCACKKAVECQEIEIAKHPGKKPKTISVIFIDEIDNVGGSRSSDESGMMKQTVNALLQAMDGFNSAENIIVIGATNNPWELDTALLRRFTDKIFINLPNDKNIEKLLVYEIYDFIIKISDPYSHLCDKKKQDDNTKLCYSECNEKNKDINYLEEILELNKKYNILPKNYNQTFNKLSNLMFVKQYSNSDLNQMFKVCLSKMGTRTIDNELFIQDGDKSAPYLSAESFKKTFSNNKDKNYDWNNNHSSINVREYFFDNVKSNELYLGSFSKENLNKFDKPYIIINNKFYLNLVYCVDRHPMLFLPFDKNIEAAYIEKDCYEAMVEYKKNQNILESDKSMFSKIKDYITPDFLSKLSRCKIIIEKNVEIISELEPLFRKYNAKLPRYDESVCYRLDKVFAIYSLFSLSGYNITSFFETTNFNQILKQIKDAYGYISKALSPEIFNKLQSYVGILFNKLKSEGSIFDIINTIQDLSIIDIIHSLMALCFTYNIFKLININLLNNGYNEYYDIYISQNYSSLLLYLMVAHNYNNIVQDNSAGDIVYIELRDKDGNFSIQFNNAIIDNNEIKNIIYKPWNYFFKKKTGKLPTHEQIMSVIKRLTTNAEYVEILINPKSFERSQSENTSIYNEIEQIMNEYNSYLTINNYPQSETEFINRDYFDFKIFSDLKTASILTKKKTLYFECEIDLLHNINKSHDNVYINWTYEKIRDSLRNISSTLFSVFKFFIRTISKLIPNIKQKVSPETIDTIDNDDNKEDLILQFTEAIQSLDLGNITYLLLSNCKSYYYMNDKTYTFNKVIVNPSGLRALDPEGKRSELLPFFSSILNLIINGVIILNYTNIVLIFLLCYIGLDSIFKILEIPNVRTFQLANLLKRDKIICPYKIFNQIHKDGKLHKIFIQSNPLIPIMNMLDDIKAIYINRILYKIFKSPKLISFSINYMNVNYNNVLYYSKLSYDEIEQKLIQNNDTTTYLRCSSNARSGTSLLKLIKGLFIGYFTNDNVEYTPIINDLDDEHQMDNSDNHPNDLELLTLEYITENYILLPNGHYQNIQTKEIKDEFTEEELEKIKEKISILPFIFMGKTGEVMTNEKLRYLRSLNNTIKNIKLVDQDEQPHNITIIDTDIDFNTSYYRLAEDIDLTNTLAKPNYDFYKHIVKPPLKNYKIHFDIVESELKNRHSTMNQKDYLDLVEYETNPDVVIEKRLKQKKTQQKPQSFLSKLFSGASI